MKLTLKIWRQGGKYKGEFVTYELPNVNPDMSFLEMLDVLNEQLIGLREDPVSFEHDCREGICGTCSMVIDGRPHGPMKGTTTCQVHMRHYHDGETIVIEPFRAQAFPVIKDLVVNRSAFDRIIQSGGYVSVNTGQAQDANAIPIEKVSGAQVGLAYVRCLRSGLPQCVCYVVYFCQSEPFGHVATGAGRAQTPRIEYDCANGQRGLWPMFQCKSLRSGMP